MRTTDTRELNGLLRELSAEILRLQAENQRLAEEAARLRPVHISGAIGRQRRRSRPPDASERLSEER